MPTPLLDDRQPRGHDPLQITRPDPHGRDASDVRQLAAPEYCGLSSGSIHHSGPLHLEQFIKLGVDEDTGPHPRQPGGVDPRARGVSELSSGSRFSVPR